MNWLAPSTGAAFEWAQALIARLGPEFTPHDANAVFGYRNGLDLTGFRDGTANPIGDEALRAALLLDPAYRGGSFALVQRFTRRYA